MPGPAIEGMRPRSLTLVFDGDCGFCTACAGLLRRLDRRGHVRLLPFQAPGVCQSLGLAPEECQAAAWAAPEGGRLARGAEALLLALGSAPGGRGIPQLYGRPRLRRAADAIYQWVARHRGRLPGVRPYCDSHPDECGRGAGPGSFPTASLALAVSFTRTC